MEIAREVAEHPESPAVRRRAQRFFAAAAFAGTIAAGLTVGGPVLRIILATAPTALKWGVPTLIKGHFDRKAEEARRKQMASEVVKYLNERSALKRQAARMRSAGLL